MALLRELADLTKKAPLRGAFLLSASLLFFDLHAHGCAPCDSALLEVAYVHDGDTLGLEDGRKLRLIGVNTPELGQGAAAEPGALSARQLLEELVSRSGGRVRLCLDAERRDRYGRTLAHLYDHRGESINRQLLKQGAGYHIAVPPNLRNLRCYQDAERQARKGLGGVWDQPIGDAAELRGNELGFRILSGRVARVGKSRSGLWLNLEGGLALRITWDDWERFDIEDPDHLLHARLEVRGWIYQRERRQRIRVRHPASIRWLEWH
ncbi:MAG: thermonuclease family protein [Candidatus Thiodiazotropha sp.]